MRHLQSLILDVVDAYERCIGSVPAELIHYHVNHHPQKKEKDHDYTIDEVKQAILILLERNELIEECSYKVKPKQGKRRKVR